MSSPSIVEVAYLAATVFLLLASFGLRVFVQLNRAKLTTEEQTRLDHVSRMAAAAAEEIGTREKWTGPQKLAYAQDLVKGAFPAINKDFMDAAIHGGLAVLNIGNTGASRATQPTEAEPVTDEAAPK